MLRTADLEYDLPQDRIATEPASPRDSSRMMVVSRSDPSRLEHRRSRELDQVLRPGDLLVFNTTRVLPARFEGQNTATGGRVQGLYLRDDDEPGAWVVLIKARRFRAGARLLLDRRGADPAPGGNGHSASVPGASAAGPGGGRASGVELELIGAIGEEGAWRVRVLVDGVGLERVAGGSSAVLERVGLAPIPPYILSARKAASARAGEEPEGGVRAPDPGRADRDLADYQTVYARRSGSVAAPTAGLHFTPELLGRLAAGGVERGEVVLHVGTGTFRPVESEHVEEHPMHSEWCSMEPPVVEAVRRTRARGGRVIAVGSTSARTLETYASAVDGGTGGAIPGSLDTRLLITPGYRWRWVDGMLTNFHLPRSTLLAMVASMLDGGGNGSGGGGGAPDGVGGGGGGVARVRSLYEEAVRGGYRFYSFGDAMLILP